jgi:hypothetical protein
MTVLSEQAAVLLELDELTDGRVVALAIAKNAILDDSGTGEGHRAWLVAKAFARLVADPGNVGDFDERCHRAINALNHAVDSRLGELVGIWPIRPSLLRPSADRSDEELPASTESSPGPRPAMS